MKIVYLHQYFNTANVAGSTRSYEFARRLVRDGHEVHIVTSDRSPSATARSWHITTLEDITIHSICQPYNNAMSAGERVRAFIGFAVSASRLARSLRGDVVFATSTPLTIAIPALVATFRRRTPFVMEVRDLWPTVPIAMGYLRNPVVRALAVGLERLAYWRASKIIALSEGMADGVKKVPGAVSKVSVIPNVSDTKRFRIASDESLEFDLQYPELANRSFVVYTGTFGRVNGLGYMAELAHEYAQLDPSLAFVAMGEGAEKLQVIDKASDMGVLNRNFFVFDSIPKKDLPRVLSRAIACASWVVPIKELEANSANKLFDAFAAGKPMLINHGGWQQDLLESSGAGLALSAIDVAAAAEKLSAHLSDEGWLNNARSASARLGEHNFEVEKLYGEFASVLKAAYEVRAGGVESKAPSATDRASR